MSNHATGPRSDEGKARSSMNALQHGVLSLRPVVPGEKVEDWEKFATEIVRDLEPVNTIERELAEQTAMLLWRQRRVVRFETSLAMNACENVMHEAIEDATGPTCSNPLRRLHAETVVIVEEASRRAAFLRHVLDVLKVLPALRATEEIPEDVCELILDKAGLLDATPQTAGELRAELSGDASLEDSIADVVEQLEAEFAEAEVRRSRAEREATEIRSKLARETTTALLDRQLLEGTGLDRVIRYEAHAGRQLARVTKHLRELQKERRERAKEGAKPQAAEGAKPPAAEPAKPHAAGVDETSFGKTGAVPAAVAERRGSFGNLREEAGAAGNATRENALGRDMMQAWARGRQNGTHRPEAPDGDTGR